ncbi:MAG: hypothetical protein ACRC0X_09345 [Brevinema sp.]
MLENTQQHFYRGQKVKSLELTHLQDYTDKGQANLISSLLGYGIVNGFEVSVVNGLLLGVTGGLAFNLQGECLVLKEGQQVNLISHAPNVGEKTIKLGMIVDYKKTEPVLDSMGETVYTKWESTVEFVTADSSIGFDAKQMAFEIAEVRINPASVVEIKKTGAEFDNLPKTGEKLRAELNKTNERTSALVTDGETTRINAPNLIINGYPYMKVDIDIVSRISRFLRVPNSELGGIKTNKIEILCDNIIIDEKVYRLPDFFMNTMLVIGTDVLVLAVAGENNRASIKLVDHTDEDYILEEGELVLGGYHVGHCREYNDKGFFKVGSNVFIGIVEDSFWTPLFRPEADPRGMVYIGNGLWWDIYLNSMEWANDKPRLVSKYDRKIATGSINTVQHNNLCQYGLCYLDFMNLFGDLNKSPINSTDYFRMCASQPRLLGVNSLSESGVRNSGKYYVDGNGLCTSVNNFGVTDLFNMIGTWAEKSHMNWDRTGGWIHNTVPHFLRNHQAQETLMASDSYSRVVVVGFNHRASHASSSFYSYYYAIYRYWYIGSRGTSITQH